MLTLSLAACSESESVGEALIKPMDSEVAGASLGTTKLVEAEVGSIYRTYSLDGMVRFSEEDIVCDLDNAYFIENYVSPGDIVNEGDPIATFRIDYSVAELERLQAELKITEDSTERREASARASVESAKNALAEIDAADARAVRRAELALERAELQLEATLISCENAVTAAEEALAEYEEKISEDTVYAESGGIVTSVEFMTEGTQVWRGRRLCSIVSYDEVSIVCDSNVAGAARHGQSATISARMFDGVIETTIVDAPMNRGAELGSFTLRLDENFIREMSETAMQDQRALGAVTVTLERFRVDDVTIIPTDALRSEDGSFFVYVLRDGELRKRYVEIGLMDTDNAQVLAGIEPGEQISVG